ncbi:MAG: gamma-glutamyl-gamma-aminobutyrate hydrolase family protein [Candidatus Micrarchaeota archaeon]|nr:gamma-glutamyl-gamma-aminobutyrate hydrolase family protein [Candidatus Micrarchaeota archaeon]
MRLHIVTHASFESPAAIRIWAEKRGHAVSHTRLYAGESLPESVDGFDFLVVMGGPQSPATTLAECPHFDAAAEIAFIQKTLFAQKPVLGVCLGAQLLCEAFGARFGTSPHKEIGVFDITLTAEAQNDPVFSTFPDAFPVGHWHGGMPGLSPDAVGLAKSAGCPRQVVRYSPKAYGFQCHFEFTPTAIEGMIQHAWHELESGKDLPYVLSAETLRAQDFGSMNEKLFAFLDFLQTQT